VWLSQTVLTGGADDDSLFAQAALPSGRSPARERAMFTGADTFSFEELENVTTGAGDDHFLLPMRRRRSAATWTAAGVKTALITRNRHGRDRRVWAAAPLPALAAP